MLRPWRTILPILVLAVLALGGPPALAAATNHSFAVKNDSAVTIQQINIVTYPAQSWGNNLIAGTTLVPGATRNFTLNGNAGCQYDVRVVFAGGDTLAYNNLNACFFSFVAAHALTKAPGGKPTSLQIFNKGDVALTQMAVVPHGSRLGTNILHAPIAPGHSTTLTIPVDRTCGWDFQATYASGAIEKRSDYNVCVIGSTTFVSPARTTPGGTSASTAPGGTSTSTAHQLIVRNLFRLPLRALYAQPAAGGHFGANLLPQSGALSPQQQHRFKLGTGCKWTLKMVYDNEWTTYAHNVDACTTNATLVLHGPTPGQRMDYGSGFFVSGNGDILTANHVVYGCGSVVITGENGDIPVAVVAQDAVHDIALLREAGVHSPYIVFRTPLQPFRPGSPAISIGYPLGVKHSRVLVGNVNALNGMFGEQSDFQYQTPTEPGNSGGPIFDGHGLVIGLTDSHDSRHPEIKFGKKGSALIRFMRSVGVTPSIAKPTGKIGAADLYDRMSDKVMRLACISWSPRAFRWPVRPGQPRRTAAADPPPAPQGRGAIWSRPRRRTPDRHWPARSAIHSCGFPHPAGPVPSRHSPAPAQPAAAPRHARSRAAHQGSPSARSRHRRAATPPPASPCCAAQSRARSPPAHRCTGGWCVPAAAAPPRAGAAVRRSPAQPARG